MEHRNYLDGAKYRDMSLTKVMLRFTCAVIGAFNFEAKTKADKVLNTFGRRKNLSYAI